MQSEKATATRGRTAFRRMTCVLLAALMMSAGSPQIALASEEADRDEEILTEASEEYDIDRTDPYSEDDWMMEEASVSDFEAPEDIEWDEEAWEILAVTAVTSGDYQYTVNADEASVTITKYLGEGGVLTIPGTIDGYTVTGIGQGAFKNCTIMAPRNRTTG